MNPHTLSLMLMHTVLAGSAGLILGLAYFEALKRTVAALTGGSGWLVAVPLTLLRVAAIALALAAAARYGATPLIAAFAGFLLARGIALRLARIGA
jgi:N-ATPase, AtpR subunit